MKKAFESSNLSPQRKTGLSGLRSERGAKPFSKPLFNHYGIWDASFYGTKRLYNEKWGKAKKITKFR
jgi:hypothetical protein